jgi:hypothetical protein
MHKKILLCLGIKCKIIHENKVYLNSMFYALFIK